MTHFHLSRPGGRPDGPAPEADDLDPAPPDLDDVEGELAEAEAIAERPAWAARADRPTTRAKLADGLRGVKRAIRADSSFFAHAYRGLLIAISAYILGVSTAGWCLLVVSAALVLIAELAYCAVVALAAAVGDPDDPTAQAATDIAAAAVLVASVTSAAITITVLVTRLDAQLRW